MAFLAERARVFVGSEGAVGIAVAWAVFEVRVGTADVGGGFDADFTCWTIWVGRGVAEGFVLQIGKLDDVEGGR